MTSIVRIERQEDVNALEKSASRKIVRTGVKAQSVKSGGETTVGDSDLFAEFESMLRGHLPGVDLFRVQPDDDDLLMSFGNITDFLAAVHSASGVNIAVEIGWLFEPTRPKHAGIEQCLLRFRLSSWSDDVVAGGILITVHGKPPRLRGILARPRARRLDLDQKRGCSFSSRILRLKGERRREVGCAMGGFANQSPCPRERRWGLS
ncbi:hypothetical protein ABE488_15560 [Luteimonas sp. TWI662]|uniref:hypothetical protein n=1 Tax=Luteimonas sp. TWI662 TaxID=3136789 RepID=UPI003208CEA9